MSDERGNSVGGSDPKDLGWMKEAFQQWDAGQPADRWDELDESLSLDAIWNKVDQSLESVERDPDSWMRESHDAWDAGVPAMNWEALDVSLDNVDVAKDQWMRDAHENWEAGSPSNGWKKLDEALSLEKVWTDLDQSLDKRGFLGRSWVAIAACVAALLICSRVNDTSFQSTPDAASFESKAIVADKSIDVVSDREVADAATNNPVTPIDAVSQSRSSQTGSSGNELAASTPSKKTNRIAKQEVQTPVKLNQESTVAQVAPPSSVKVEDPGTLNFRVLTNEEKTLQALRLPKLKVPYHHWTLRVGMQVAFLPEKNRSELTSALPGFGMTSDLSFKHRLKSVQMIYAFGLCKYAQQTGKYVNGRYSTQHQQLNAMQLSAAVAYDYRRWMVFGGPFATKVLSGIEQKSNTITNVYNFNSLQLGVIAGLDYKIFVSPVTGKHVSVGLQYQWIPRPLGQNASFENIQSVRLQGKFSF